MSIVHSKTWYSVVDADTTVLGLDVSTVAKANASGLWVMKQYLIGQTPSGTTLGWTGARPSSSYWTVVGSSDGATAGLDGVDRWGTTFNTAKLVPNLSWIVLKHPTTNWYLQLGCNTIAGNGVDVRMYYQATSPTGGNATTLPTWTATVLNSNMSDAYLALGAASTQSRYHFTVDAGGSFWFAMNTFGVALQYFGFQQLINGPASDTNPYAFFPTSYIDMVRSYIGSTAVQLGVSVPTYSYTTSPTSTGNFSLASRSNPSALTLNGEKFLRGPVSIAPTTTTQYFEPKGTVPDMYNGFYAPSYSRIPTTGNCLLACCSGTSSYSQAGGVWLPFTAQPTAI